MELLGCVWEFQSHRACAEFPVGTDPHVKLSLNLELPFCAQYCAVSRFMLKTKHIKHVVEELRENMTPAQTLMSFITLCLLAWSPPELVR